MKTFWQTLASVLDDHGAAVTVRVADVRGSTPREAGAWMVVTPEGGYHGTIGGGALEWRAIAEAQRLFAGKRAARLMTQALGPELGQCCGGSVSLLVERFEAERLNEVRVFAGLEASGPFVTRGRICGEGVTRTVVADGEGLGLVGSGGVVERFGERQRPVLLFGAGHVGRALVLALAPLPYAVRWIDGRAGEFPSAFPASVTAVYSADPAGELTAAPDDAFILVMTHSHALDQEIVHAALSADRFAHIGLIGSATKRARFTNRLVEAGIPADRVAERLVCPIGLTAIRSKHPAAIAAGIAADLLVRHEGVVATSTTLPRRVSALGGE